jgi:hypothetical protein
MAAAAANSAHLAHLAHLAALYNIKKEPAQEPRLANSHDEQHAAAARDSDQAAGDLAALAVPAGAIGAAAAAQQRASAVSNQLWPVPGNDQAVGDGVESGEEKDCEQPVSKRRKTSWLKTCVATSAFLGVICDNRMKTRKWVARINHDGKYQHLGHFDNEHEAARAFDTAARQLRGEDARSGRAGNNWLRLNFPTVEAERAAAEAAAAEAAQVAAAAKQEAAVVKAEQEVSAPSCKACDEEKLFGGTHRTHECGAHTLPVLDGRTKQGKEQIVKLQQRAQRAQQQPPQRAAAKKQKAEAARAAAKNQAELELEQAAEAAEAESKMAQKRGALLTNEDEALAVPAGAIAAAAAGAIAEAAAAQQRASAARNYVRPVPGNDQAVGDEVGTTSEYVGVCWHKKNRKWRAGIWHDGKRQHLGSFDDEHEAARAFDTAARRLRGDEAHGGQAGSNWLRLNFPTEDDREVQRAKDSGALLQEDRAAATSEVDVRSSTSAAVTAVPVPRRQRHDVAPKTAGRRLEYRFDVNGQPQWFGGKVLRDIDNHWVDVLFDDGDELCVKIPPAGAGTAWRWLEANETDTSDSDQAADVEEASEEEGCQPVPKRWRNNRAKSSVFVGVHWHRQRRKWEARIRHDGKPQYMGYFDDEREAARAFDTAARRLRGENAHGGRKGSDWHRLNFPTEIEVSKAEERGAQDRAAAAASERQGPSTFVGVSWFKKNHRWAATISHDGKKQHLGYFDDEQEAAQAVDTAARLLRGEDAHGGRSGKGNWLRLNFPTEEEVKRAQERGALLTEEDKAAAAAASHRQGPSKFVGVCWNKESRKWKAEITHDGKQQYLGYFADEREAARAVDTAARRLRGEDAHGGRCSQGKQWLRLNFPTEREVKRAQERGALRMEDKVAAVAASEQQAPSAASGRQELSEFVGVSWDKSERRWKAQINHDGKRHYLGSFDDDQEGARAVDTAARRLRGDNAHGGRSGNGTWLRLNFPTEGEVKRADERGALLTAEDRAAAAAASDQQGPSKFVGVSWYKRDCRWRAEIRHNGKQQCLGCFDDEREAARAVDTAARRLRGENAHGGRAQRHWLRLNFPTEGEVKRADERGAVTTEEVKVAAPQARKPRASVVVSIGSDRAVDDVDSCKAEVHEPVPKRRRASSAKWSEFTGVTWSKERGKWQAQMHHDRKNHTLGYFDDEREAARGVDTAARHLRGEDSHGGRSGRNWHRLNFPTEGEVKRAQEGERCAADRGA